jgi:hypothetical protein
MPRRRNTDPSLPRKRLIWAVVYGEHYVVHYERGGRGHSFHILVATLAKTDLKPNVVWRAVGGRLKDYAAFRSSVLERLGTSEPATTSTPGLRHVQHRTLLLPTRFAIPGHLVSQTPMFHVCPEANETPNPYEECQGEL